MKKNFKVARGFLEEEQRKEEIRTSNQKIALIILPILMVAILLIGIFFGYKSYREQYADITVSTPDNVKIEKGNIDLTDDELMLTYVDSANTLDKDFVPDLVQFRGVYISPVMKDSLERMLDDSKKAGEELELESGYISYEEQDELYKEAIEKYKKKNNASVVKAESEVKKKIPPAGESEQQTGLIVSLDADVKVFKTSSQYAWLMKNAADYGFVLRYEDDENIGGMGYNSHLYRYVGVENAMKMRFYNLDFEEYVNYLQNK